MSTSARRGTGCCVVGSASDGPWSRLARASPVRCHPGGDHIQISPPFTISEAEIGSIVAALDDALSQEASRPLAA